MSDPTEITNTNWRENTLGMTMCGGSGAGKTTTARCLHDQYPGTSIIFNLDHEPNMGHVVHSVGELKQALADGRERIDVRPPVTEVEEPELFPEIVRFLLAFGKHFRETDGRIQFLMDEAQDLQTKWVKVAIKRLRKRRIKPVAMTQDPISLDTSIRKVADFNCWLSPPDPEMKRNLERHTGYPADLLTKLDPYQMLVLGDGWEPVARFMAGEEYAE